VYALLSIPYTRTSRVQGGIARLLTIEVELRCYHCPEVTSYYQSELAEDQEKGSEAGPGVCDDSD
jgi:hypothetical protein